MSTAEANQPTALEAFRERWIQSETAEQYAARRKQLQSAQPHLFDSHKGQENLGVGRWITIGSEKAVDGEHHGGHHIFVGEDGKMKTGAFAGQTMQEAFGKPPNSNAYKKGDRVRVTDKNSSYFGKEGMFVSYRDGLAKVILPTTDRLGRPGETDWHFEESQIEPAGKEAPDNGARLDAMQQAKAHAETIKPRTFRQPSDETPTTSSTVAPGSTPDPWLSSPSQTKPNEEATGGDQLGLFGEAFKKPATSKPFKPTMLDAKAKQQGLFDTHGNANQMDFFGDGVMPDDLVYKPEKQPDAKAAEVAPQAEQKEFNAEEIVKAARASGKNIWQQSKEMGFGGIADLTAEQRKAIGEAVTNNPSEEPKPKPPSEARAAAMEKAKARGVLEPVSLTPPQTGNQPAVDGPKEASESRKGPDLPEGTPIPLRDRKNVAKQLAESGMSHSGMVEYLSNRMIAAVDARKLASDALGDVAQSETANESSQPVSIPASNATEQPNVAPMGPKSIESESKPSEAPESPQEDLSPTAKANSDYEKSISKGSAPREAARAAQKELDADYEYARASSIRNAGEDLKGSARHKVNAWKSLEDAEKNGTAAALVTRDQLMKNEPHDLMVHASKNPVTALAMHFAMRSFPPKPGTGKRGDHAKDREQFLDAYRKVKGKAESLVKDHENPIKAMGELQSYVKGLIDELRGAKRSNSYLDRIGAATSDATDKYNQTANDLVGLHNALSTGYGAAKIGPASRLVEFMKSANDKYGNGWANEGDLIESVASHAQDIMEGKSMNATFGKESNQVKRFNPADAYVKHAKRTGGRDLSKIVSDPNKATKHLVDSFGVRGVQWGNTVSDEERKHHAARTVEALTDLADVVGLHPMDIALDGKLGLAIGARGKGNASAHYEPGTQVINLTRASGVGALAHEWGHAFDHMLNEFGTSRKDIDSARSSGDYMSGDHQYTHHLISADGKTKWNATGEEKGIRPGWSLVERPKVAIRNAYKQWWKKAANYRRRLETVLKDEVKAGTMSRKKAHEYWNSPHEIFARTFERHVSHKLNEDDRENTYLSGLGGEHPLWPTKAEAKEMAEAFDGIFTAYRAHKYGSEEPIKYSRKDAGDIFASLLYEPSLLTEQYAGKNQFTFDFADTSHEPVSGAKGGRTRKDRAVDEAAANNQLRIVGTSEDHTQCERCGRDDLKKTIVVEVLDGDSNGSGEFYYYGSDCISKIMGQSSAALEKRALSADYAAKVKKQADDSKLKSRPSDTKGVANYNYNSSNRHSVGSYLVQKGNRFARVDGKDHDEVALFARDGWAKVSEPIKFNSSEHGGDAAMLKRNYPRWWNEHVSEEEKTKYSMNDIVLSLPVERYEWVESNHPRMPAGSPKGGEFTNRGMGGSTSVSSEVTGSGGQAAAGANPSNQQSSDPTTVGEPAAEGPPKSTQQRELVERPDTQQHHSLHYSNIKDWQWIPLNDCRRLMAGHLHEGELRARHALGNNVTAEDIWNHIDKQKLQHTLDYMNTMNHKSIAEGGKRFDDICNYNGVIPKIIAERLGGGERFFDPRALRGRWYEEAPAEPQPPQPASQTEPDQSQAMEQPESVPDAPSTESAGQPQADDSQWKETAAPKAMPRISEDQFRRAFTPKPPAGVTKAKMQKVEKAIRSMISDNDEVVAAFRPMVVEAWQQLKREAEDHNSAIREMTSATARTLSDTMDDAGHTTGAKTMQSLSAMVRKARNGDLDPSKKRGFDELVDKFERNYPHMLRGRGEDGLLDLLSQGIKPVPDILDEDVAERAITLAGPGFFESFDQGEDPSDESFETSDFENAPFSWLGVPEQIAMVRYQFDRKVERYVCLSDAQREAGNYKMKHTRFKGLAISIETSKGQKRKPQWPAMPCDYGYIKGTLGRDGDHVDVFMGPSEESDLVVVVDQVRLDGSFDEHKVLLGFNSESEAIETYKKAYTKDWKVGPVTTMTIDQFKAWLRDGSTSKKISTQVSRYGAVFEPVLTN